MSTELIVQIAARLRELSDAEFRALEELVLHGREGADAAALGAACDALRDCAELVRLDEGVEVRVR